MRIQSALSRLLTANQHPGLNVGATPQRAYTYAFDRAGNRLSEALSLNGAAPTVTSRSYNAANQIASAGFSYDANGNLTSDGVNAYTWDRANRLLSMGGASYGYDGLGNRLGQTVGANVTQYLLDVQPGLSVVLAAVQGANTTRYVHGPLGIHAHKDTANNWEWPLQDGLGSVRGVADNRAAVLETRQYDPYGTPFGTTGTNQTMYGYTGEPTDGNGLVHLRVRHYAPGLGVFITLDPLELGNRYQYVFSNPINMTDPTGLQPVAACASNPANALFCTLAAAAGAISTGVGAPVVVTGGAVAAFGLYLVNGVANADWVGYQAYNDSLAAANQGRYPDEAPPTYLPDAGGGYVPGYNPLGDEAIYTATPMGPLPPQPPLNNSPNGLGRLLAALLAGAITGLGLKRLIDEAGCPQPQTTITPMATPTATPEQVLVSHYTDQESAQGILSTEIIGGFRVGENHVYVMEGRSTPRRAQSAGAGSVEARIVFNARRSEIALDPAQQSREPGAPLYSRSKMVYYTWRS